MEKTYRELADQLFKLPIAGFEVNDAQLNFNGVDLMAIIAEHGTPLKLTYLPKITEKITEAKAIFAKAMAKANYKGDYTYCYCTKSAHFSFVLEEALKNGVQIETSSAFDIHILNRLIDSGKIDKTTILIHNGYKRELYLELIADLINRGYNSMPILDNKLELAKLMPMLDRDINIGLRIATGEEPASNYYSSRLGIRRVEVLDFFEAEIKPNRSVKLKMLHFFIDSGIEDSSYYWDELAKCVETYCALKKLCPDLHTLNIGGGFPVCFSLVQELDHQGLADGIIRYIKEKCDEENIPEPDIFTEFGSYTVAESGAVIYSIIDQKKQNDVECWNMIDSSFINTLPDSWAINQKFILLPINRWNEPYEQVNLGGLTCDSLDHYNQEAHDSSIFMPKYNADQPLYIGFFHTGAYQQALGGYGGLQHCLIPSPKQVLIGKNEDGSLYHEVFSEEQKPDYMMKILGY
ncbi:MAG: arginine decarboxylase [Bacteroidia bacterium]|jgi:arginine decarboxylase